MSTVKIWHNPRCSKSRDSLKFLEGEGVTIDIIKYLETHPTEDDIKALLKMLGFSSAQKLMRKKEDIYKELNLKDEESEDKLIEAMVKNPKLIERPIVIKDNRAVIGRPIENVINLIKD